MAHLSNKFNLLVLLLVVPAIIAALGADISVNAAPNKRIQRRSAFLAPKDSVIEARDLSEINHELFGREFADHELVRRNPNWKSFKEGFKKVVGGAFHAIVGRTPIGRAAKVAGNIASATQQKRETDEYTRRAVPQPPAAVDQHKLAEGSSNHKTPSAKHGTGGGVHAISTKGQGEPVRSKPAHYEHGQGQGRSAHHDYHEKGFHVNPASDVPPHHNQYTASQFNSHHGTGAYAAGGDKIPNHENEMSSHAPLRDQAAAPHGTAGHRRSFYYDMEDLD